MKRALVVLFFAASVAWPQESGTLSMEDAPFPDLPPAEIAGEIASERASPEEMTGDWPSIASATDGSAWMAWVEWDAKNSDRVLLVRRPRSRSTSRPRT